MSDVQLTSTAVTEVFRACLVDPGTEDAIEVDGIVHKAMLSKPLLEENKGKIEAFLAELPSEFQEKGGGGMSFLNACNDKHGMQWGEHVNMEQLFMLGLGIERVKCLLPRDMWEVLPGGMPYYVVLEPHA
jgi:hypothetical protein